MSAGLQELRDDQLDEALERALLPQLTEVISQREPGHCLRVADLSAGLATRLCRRLRSASATPHCYVLAPAAAGAALPADVAVTSTKLIELRNPDASGALRPVLVVFIPPGSKASAEDSFGVATFEDIAVADVYDLVVTRLAEEVPAGLHAMIAGELFAALDETAWPYADTLARARYLLTVRHNDFDAQAAGAAVFELGLVPDFDLFRHPGQAEARARANIDAMRTLTFVPRSERQRVLELGLTDAGLQRRLAEFAADAGLDDPRSWTRRIVIDSTNWRLGFHEWALAQPTVARELRIDVLDIDLPVAEPGTADGEDSPLGRLIGQQYLAAGPKGRDKLTTRFRIDPDARRVPGLAKFSVQIHSEDAGGTGIGASVKTGRTGKTEFTATISRLTKSSWDEGWHFVRVVPLDADGQPILISGHNTARSAESDRFYVVTGDRESAEPPERTAGNAPGLIQALRGVQFAVLADGGDADAVTLRGLMRRPSGRGRAGTVRAGFTGSHLVDILLPGPWERIEAATLAEPGTFYRWGLALTPKGLGEPVCEAVSWPLSADRHELAAFASARTAVLSAVAQTGERAIELVDVRDFREAIRAYAGTYKDLLARQLRRAETSDGAERAATLRGLSDLLRLDTVHVDISDYRGERREALLIAPTHPLRLLWLLTWAETAGVWLRWSSGSSAEEILATRNTLLDVLTGQGFPFALPHADGRLLIASDDLTPYWGIALPSETSDPHGLVSDLRTALKLGGTPDSEPDLAARLADRMERYLRLHPYVDTLVINAVNAGRADLLADSLRLVHRRPGFQALRFDVRLIVEDPEAPGIGDRLTELIAPGGDSGSAGDGLAVPVTDHLRPRLAVAVQSIDEFRDDPGGQAAHLTVLIDAFTAERVDAALPVLATAGGAARGRGIAPVHGLVQKTVTRYREDADTIAWHRQPRHGASYPLPGAEELSDLLAELPAIISQAAAALATGDPATARIPTVTLDLNTADRVLLYQAHNVSDWVITIDRTLSLEYFDHGGGPDRPDYVIDHDTDQVTATGRRIVVSSRSADELRALLAPVIDQHGLRLDPRHAGTFFDQMRFLSGRLAFKLASTARTQRTEVLGLSLARLYLDYQGVLREQVLVPLDAHQDLYREPRARRTAASRVDQQRTDLALFDLDAQARRITCRLVEVKCYTTLGEISDYERLKDRIAAQLDASADLISHHFDPRRLGVDRPDRTVKNMELSALLGHYLERAIRHRVMDADAASEASWLLEHLDAGYRLDFTRTGLVFDLARAGTDSETDRGIEFHRIGRDLIQELVDAVPTQPSAEPAAPPTPDANTIMGQLADLELTLPRLPEAAFQAAERTHETPEIDLGVLDPQDREPEPGEAGDATDKAGRPPQPEAQPRPADRPPTAADSGQLNDEPPGKPSRAKRQDLATSALPPVPDVFLGTTKATAQFGIIGRTTGRTIALDLDETHTISLFGVQGGGKSYTLGSIIEMATLPIPGVNRLANPLATILFHYSQSQTYAPEFTSMVNANDDAAQVQALASGYGARPRAHRDIVLLAPADHVEQRRTQYPGITVRPLVFNSAELQASHWRFLMGAVGNQSTYIRQLTRIMRANRGSLTLPSVRAGVDASGLSDTLKQLAHQRLDLAAEYIDDTAHLRDLVRPGRLIIVDLRDDLIEKDEALGLFVVLMQLFADAQHQGQNFNKLVVFDEAHKYIDSPDLVDGLVEAVREMRHKGMSILVASQDPPSVPTSLIELSNHIVMHKFTSPSWLKHLQRANAALAGLTPEKLAQLAPGEAFVWSSKATDVSFTHSAIKVNWRPRATHHGGTTRTATRN